MWSDGAGAVAGEWVLQLEDVKKSFRDVLALDEVSFGIKKGEIFGYIGPNGAGKTTTIKIMVGLIKDFTGRLVLDGVRVKTDAGAVQRILGYLPQKAAFQDWRTVEQALSTFGRLSGMSKDDIAMRIPKVLDLLGISETRRRRIAHLSGGTVQKVGMAQAVLHDPRLLVLDEPMSGLDPASRYQFKEIFKNLRDQGTTIFFSSHILGDVQDIADRIGILDRGKILHVGTFDELRGHLVVPKDVEIVLSSNWRKDLDPKVSAMLTALDQLGPDHLLAHVRNDVDLDHAIDALIDGFRSKGYHIRVVRQVVPDLEEIYVQLFGGVRA